MANDGTDAGDGRPSTPRRITLQGRTFGKIELGTVFGSSDDMALDETIELQRRVSGPHRTTDPRRSVG